MSIVCQSLQCIRYGLSASAPMISTIVQQSVPSACTHQYCPALRCSASSGGVFRCIKSCSFTGSPGGASHCGLFSEFIPIKSPHTCILYVSRKCRTVCSSLAIPSCIGSLAPVSTLAPCTYIPYPASFSHSIKLPPQTSVTSLCCRTMYRYLPVTVSTCTLVAMWSNRL